MLCHWTMDIPIQGGQTLSIWHTVLYSTWRNKFHVATKNNNSWWIYNGINSTFMWDKLTMFPRLSHLSRETNGSLRVNCYSQKYYLIHGWGNFLGLFPHRQASMAVISTFEFEFSSGNPVSSHDWPTMTPVNRTGRSFPLPALPWPHQAATTTAVKNSKQTLIIHTSAQWNRNFKNWPNNNRYTNNVYHSRCLGQCLGTRLFL